MADENDRHSFTLDHVGVVVPDMTAGLAFYVDVLGFELVATQGETDVDPKSIGLPGERVRLKGSFLNAGTAYIELHEYTLSSRRLPRRVDDHGFGHIALATHDIQAAVRYLKSHGVRFNSEPKLHVGDLAGLWWVYGEDPWGNVLELVQRTSA